MLATNTSSRRATLDDTLANQFRRWDSHAAEQPDASKTGGASTHAALSSTGVLTGWLGGSAVVRSDEIGGCSRDLPYARRRREHGRAGYPRSSSRQRDGGRQLFLL
jgi:hypothetical protein